MILENSTGRNKIDTMISPIVTGQFSSTAKLAFILSLALDKKFEELFFKK